ncbi:PadR family transcriptional regulator [Halomontanus rarus]|uniref:PadR family transcriptional regulator n=1 Tax=Halomontanus rarus TaxID=3034020 RepID=UPI0023E7CFBB|nr:helix-turn-helix transcriptional regulator [Halovivax sp. TS33]
MAATDRSAPQTATRLNGFQRDLLFVLAKTGPENGQSIRSELQPEYENEIHHARLYANLDKLVDRGLVEKGEIDGRTNEYELTSEGRRVLTERHEWQAECVEEVDA